MKKYKVLVTFEDKYLKNLNIIGSIVEYSKERAAEINTNLKKYGTALEEIVTDSEEKATKK